jgi:HlyD family secretion protein
VAESYPDREFPGVVTQIHPLAVVQQNVTTFEVTTKVDNSEGFLMAGMDVSVEIIAAHKENAILVPREALTDVKSITKMIGSSSGARNQFAAANRSKNSGRSRSGSGAAGSGGGPGGPAGGPGGPEGGPPPGGAEGGGPPGGPGGEPGGANKPDTSLALTSKNQTSNPLKVVIVIVNGKQEPRQVEIGLSNFEMAEVISGLSEGETVLTTVTSEALKDRQEFLDRMKGWGQLPGMGGPPH